MLRPRRGQTAPNHDRLGNDQVIGSRQTQGGKSIACAAGVQHQQTKCLIGIPQIDGARAAVSPVGHAAGCGDPAQGEAAPVLRIHRHPAAATAEPAAAIVAARGLHPAVAAQRLHRHVDPSPRTLSPAAVGAVGIEPAVQHQAARLQAQEPATRCGCTAAAPVVRIGVVPIHRIGAARTHGAPPAVTAARLPRRPAHGGVPAGPPRQIPLPVHVDLAVRGHRDCMGDGQIQLVGFGCGARRVSEHGSVNELKGVEGVRSVDGDGHTADHEVGAVVGRVGLGDGPGRADDDGISMGRPQHSELSQE